MRKSNREDPGGQRVIVSSRFLSVAARTSTRITLVVFEVELCVCVVFRGACKVDLFLDFGVILLTSRVFWWRRGADSDFRSFRIKNDLFLDFRVFTTGYLPTNDRICFF